MGHRNGSRGTSHRPSGREPTEARSAVGLRRVLAWFGLLVGLAGAALAWLVVDPAQPIIGILCLLISAGALVDLVVLARR
ncbi:MAG: hypothetical protein QOK30_3158 [Nocardioidaceae bacterium]|nr:hypothetical protein [Nocardioidaceae bacterium]